MSALLYALVICLTGVIVGQAIVIRFQRFQLECWRSAYRARIAALKAVRT